jgi:hypothetical protein
MKRTFATFASYTVAGVMLAIMCTPDRMFFGMALVLTTATLLAIIDAIAA